MASAEIAKITHFIDF